MYPNYGLVAHHHHTTRMTQIAGGHGLDEFVHGRVLVTEENAI